MPLYDFSDGPDFDTLEQFTVWMVNKVVDFRIWYYNQYDANPLEYPKLMQPAEWHEQFNIWLELEREGDGDPETTTA